MAKRGWIFISATFGDSDMLAAGERLRHQAEETGLFDHIQIYNFEDLQSLAPFIWANYREYLTTEHKGFGYFCWKPELVLRTLQKYSEYGLMWADAGCELHGGLFRTKRLKHMMNSAIRTGSFLYKLDYPEYRYTKPDIYNFFSNLEYPDNSPQIQATWFMLSGSLGMDIASRWFASSANGIHMLDLNTAFSTSGLIEHRFDQSLLSLTCKSLMIKPKKHIPAGRPVSLLGKLNCAVHPIWASRNRSGKSLK